MYSLEEAEKELQAEKDEGLRGQNLVHRLDSSSAPEKSTTAREEKHSQRMSALTRLVDNKQSDVPQGSSQTHPAHSHSHSHSHHHAVKYPPMPLVGQPVEFLRLRSRNEVAQETTEALLALSREEICDAQTRARNVPVQGGRDRVVVTEAISTAMAAVRSKQGLEQRLHRNTADIQRALAYRKAALTTMNSNYSDVLVRRVEPIYAHESRTVVVHKNSL
jgi:hypothetical protein